MKILHVGNMANLGYVMVSHLRTEGIEAELLMEKNPPPLSEPLKFDSDLKNKYPEWISFYDKISRLWKYDIIKKMRNKKYDIIQAYVELPIFAYLARKPFIVYTQGSDLRELAFSNSIRGWLLRRAYRKSKLVMLGQPDHLPLTKKLKLKNVIFLPAPWIPKQKLIKKSKNHSNSFVIFHPSALYWRLKGNDILIRGFAKFIKNNRDSLLLLVARGPDLNKTKELIKSLDIESNIKFLNTLSQDEMSKFYSQSDIVADQFIIGSMGGIALEALYAGKPLLTFINEELHEKVYPEIPPVANAKNSEEVYLKLIELNDKNFQNSLGDKGRDWVTKYHSPESIVSQLKIIYQSILNDDSLEKIKERLNLK